MPITIKCPECGDKRSVPDEFAGKKLKCKNCSAIFRASAPPPPLPDDEERESRHPAAKSRKVEDDDDRPRRSARNDEDEEPRSRRRDEDDDDIDEKSRKRQRDDDDEDEEPRSRRRDEDESEDPPRRKKPGERGKSKPKKKKVTPGYIIGVILASLFLAGALGFVAWRAGLFQEKSDDKDRVENDDKEPEYVAPDPRIGAGRKETIGRDGERVAGAERIRLTMDLREEGAGNHQVVLTFEVISGPGLGANDRIVVREADRAYVLQAAPEIDKEDPKRGTYTFSLTDESRRKAKKFWIAIVTGKPDDVLKGGLRVSNVVALP